MNLKCMPERSPSPKSVLSNLDEVFLHELNEMENKAPKMDTNAIDEMENRAPEIDTNDIGEMENIAPEIDTNDMDEIENIAPEWLPLTRRTLNLIDVSHCLMMLFRISF